MVLFIKPPAIIAQVTLVFNPSKRDSFLSCPHALCKQQEQTVYCNIKTEVKLLSAAGKVVFCVSRELSQIL